MNDTSIVDYVSAEVYRLKSTTKLSATRVLIVDDHGIVREGLAMLLARAEHISVVGSAATGEEAVEAAAELIPDVIIMDLMLPDVSGVDATRRILAHTPAMRIIALSACRTADAVYSALRAGARGYVLKAAATSELVDAVDAIMAGNRYISPPLLPLLGDDINGKALPKSPFDKLSEREREVLRRIVAGSSSSAIAQHLSLSRKTIDTYRGRLMIKLGVPNRSALIRMVIEHELIAP
jgi:DNA-binding NarL/FixJ family response regulator